MKQRLPAIAFVVTALALFVLGVAGMFFAAQEDSTKLLGLYFSMAFFLAPAVLVYPAIRFFVGEGKPLTAAVLSAIFGAWVQSSIKNLSAQDKKYRK